MQKTVKPKPLPKIDHIAITKTKLAAAESECNNLGQQITRSEQFASELRGKLLQAQGKYANCAELLKEFEPTAKPQKDATTP